MRYSPRKAPAEVNVSAEHPLIEAGTLITALTLIFGAIALVLILLVDFVLLFVSPEKEAELFSRWVPQDLIAVDDDDQRLTALNALTQRLSLHWDDAPYDFRVGITADDSLNAMALPGGLIVVTSGLLDRVESENELAFILGHELGHFRNRDHIRGLGRGVALSMFFAAISGSDSGLSLGASVSDLTLRGFSRGQESDADEFGLRVVNREYGHVADAWRFFERIERDEELLFELSGYLSTHPTPDDRVDRLFEHAGVNGWSVNGEVSALPW